MLGVKEIIISQSEINSFIPEQSDVSVKNCFNSIILKKMLSDHLKDFPSLKIDFWSIEEELLIVEKKYKLTVAVKLLFSTN